MKKIFKILAYIFCGITVLAIAFLIYFNSSYPKVDPPPNENVEITPARIERGEYLAKHVAVCMDCHSTRDWSKFSGPPKIETWGMGGDRFGEEIGFPGTLYAKNITPASIGNWSDGEIMRAITCGVNKDGGAFFPLMPYLNYNKMTKEDLYSIVAYLRSIKPIENKVKEGSLNFPLNFIVKTIPPQSFHPSTEPDKNNSAKYGEYITNIAGCFDCHTQSVKGEYVMGKGFAGGAEFSFPGGVVRSANITPDKNTGISSWTKEQFIARFKVMDPDSNQIPNVNRNDYNTVMPWTMYAGMSREDLGAIYDYLKTLKPIYNSVAKWTPHK
ncbi:MAG: cytochrome C [Bacteroidota bacterium]